METEIVIQSGELPPPVKRKLSPLVETARKMQVGNYIVVPYPEKKNAMAYMTRGTGFKFTQRLEKAEDGDQLKIWRVE